VETSTFEPKVVSVGKVHREIDMSTQCLEAGVVKSSDRTHVAGYRPNREILIAASDGLSDYPFDKNSSHASAAKTTGDDDRLDLAAGPAIKQAGKADNPTIEIGHPGRHSFWHSQIVVKGIPRIVASDRGVFVDPSMMLSQFHPQHPTGGIVSRRIVTDNDVGRA
jgi:hypothetical protein